MGRSVRLKSASRSTFSRPLAEGGVDLPSMCEQGWCISCAARIVEGEVDQSDSLRYYKQDREARFALLCTAKPRSDLRIVSHRSAELRHHRDVLKLPAPRGT
jgi:ferredoxin